MFEETILTAIVVVSAMLYPDAALASPRSETVKMMCGKQAEHNATLYVPNFVATMETISAQMRSSGFGQAITGSGPDANYGLAQCYGDLSLIDCVLCYAEARTLLPQCFPSNGGRIFLDGCFMRAENYPFFREHSGPGDRALCGNTTRDPPAFKAAARQAVSEAVSDAVNGGGFGRAARVAEANQSAYVLAECWRTIDAGSCRACLENASDSVLRCLPSSDGRALNTGCFLRYSDADFMNPVPRNRSERGVVIVIVIATVSVGAVVAIGAMFGVYICKQRKIQKKRKGCGEAERYVKSLNDSSLNFKYSTLEKATGCFDEANKLGEGGFGSVYKGVMADGREIAVKRLYFNNKHRAADFYNEVKIISTVEHKNLVRLLGCSCSGPESLLVYEYLPNKSLDRFIFDSSRGKALRWETRLEIILGTAEGLVYLHENSNMRIIHRDIKASNILLDSRLAAKIADFGLARSFQEDKTHISTAIAGTLGYMAPEYLAHGQLTEKADVYSFGVLLLEIVTGRQNNRSKHTDYSDSLINIAWKHFQERRVEELFDINLMLSSSRKDEAVRVVHIGLLCTQEISSLRPTMSRVMQMLVSEAELAAPTSPPFLDDTTMELSEIPSHYGNGAASVANISHSILYPR
ncbi:cysteine-rich receptor-like protein kinase 2 [Salvia splendens]|nr:cysteine-rich receptor-like protein kinase 2 [Salvia splendens]